MEIRETPAQLDLRDLLDLVVQLVSVESLDLKVLPDTLELLEPKVNLVRRETSANAVTRVTLDSLDLRDLLE